jgi:Spy/CpxP family protein refolding chaperone
MRKKIMPAVGIAVIFILAVAGAQSVAAQVPRTWMRGAPALDLTDEQFLQIQKIRLKFQEEILSLETRWRRVSLDLDELEWKGVDRAAIEAKIKELDRTEAELDKRYLDHRNEIRSVLTEDQRAVFDRTGGLGLGWGPGWGAGMAPRWGMRWGGGRGRGAGWGPGMGLGSGRGYGRAYGRGWGPGLGRGYFCPWFRRW